jgi:hypothetical protein
MMGSKMANRQVTYNILQHLWHLISALESKGGGIGSEYIFTSENETGYGCCQIFTTFSAMTKGLALAMAS